MRNRTLKALCVTLFLLAACARAAWADGIFQYSTIDALLAGLYDGDLAVSQLRTRGDFGLGTFNTLDGEMVMLDGVVYHAMAGGEVVVAPDSTLMPFAVVTHFVEGSTTPLGDVTSLERLNTVVRARLSSRNAFYALRMDGRFDSVTVRAIPPQHRPYKPLAEVVSQQVVVDLPDIEGSLVGFWTPACMKGLNVPGFHWHFVSADGTKGGHVMGCAFSGLSIRMAEIREFSMSLPSGAFDALDLTPDRGKELHRVENEPGK